MHRHDRLTQLLELLAARGHVEVDELSAELGVSEATIRRDLNHLAHQQLLTRTRGGAVVQQVAYDLPLRYKAARRAEEKLRIGAAAAAMVQRGMVVGLNGGTTVTEVARAMVVRPELAGAAGEPGVTIVTNALNIAHELTVRPSIKLVITGGVARPQSYELIGPLAGRILDEITLDLMVLVSMCSIRSRGPPRTTRARRPSTGRCWNGLGARSSWRMRRSWATARSHASPRSRSWTCWSPTRPRIPRWSIDSNRPASRWSWRRGASGHRGVAPTPFPGACSTSIA